jgi:hypothetical protein
MRVPTNNQLIFQFMEGLGAAANAAASYKLMIDEENDRRLFFDREIQAQKLVNDFEMSIQEDPNTANYEQKYSLLQDSLNSLKDGYNLKKYSESFSNMIDKSLEQTRVQAGQLQLQRTKEVGLQRLNERAQDRINLGGEENFQAVMMDIQENRHLFGGDLAAYEKFVDEVTHQYKYQEIHRTAESMSYEESVQWLNSADERLMELAPGEIDRIESAMWDRERFRRSEENRIWNENADNLWTLGIQAAHSNQLSHQWVDANREALGPTYYPRLKGMLQDMDSLPENTNGHSMSPGMIEEFERSAFSQIMGANTQADHDRILSDIQDAVDMGFPRAKASALISNLNNRDANHWDKAINDMVENNPLFKDRPELKGMFWEQLSAQAGFRLPGDMKPDGMTTEQQMVLADNVFASLAKFQLSETRANEYRQTRESNRPAGLTGMSRTLWDQAEMIRNKREVFRGDPSVEDRNLFGYAEEGMDTDEQFLKNVVRGKFVGMYDADIYFKQTMDGYVEKWTGLLQEMGLDYKAGRDAVHYERGTGRPIWEVVEPIPGVPGATQKVYYSLDVGKITTDNPLGGRGSMETEYPVRWFNGEWVPAIDRLGSSPAYN